MTRRVLAAARHGAAVADTEMAAIPHWIWDRAELPVPIERIALEQYGFLVEERDLSDTVTDRYVSGILIPERWRIHVDRLESARAPGRRRFTIAHELGHWVLHHRSAVRPSESPQQPATGALSGLNVLPAELEWMAGYPTGELEANQFAAAMLMPSGLLDRAERNLSDIEGLARLFGVSEYAAKRRVEFLGAIPLRAP